MCTRWRRCRNLVYARLPPFLFSRGGAFLALTLFFIPGGSPFFCISGGLLIGKPPGGCRKIPKIYIFYIGRVGRINMGDRGPTTITTPPPSGIFTREGFSGEEVTEVEFEMIGEDATSALPGVNMPGPAILRSAAEGPPCTGALEGPAGRGVRGAAAAPPHLQAGP